MKTKTCPDCNGDGVVNKGTDDEQQCPTCGGHGFVPDDDDGHEEVIKTVTIASFAYCAIASGDDHQIPFFAERGFVSLVFR